MLGYFTDRPPFLLDFHDWVEDEFHLRNGWRVNHTQYVGKNFFLIEFEEVEDRDAALTSAPWFFGQKYLYIFP